MGIEKDINQQSFRNDYQKAAINLIYTYNWLNEKMKAFFDREGITGQQFNILRILKGMHPEPASVKLLTERMIDKMSNASRLVEKLKKKDLVDRVECPADRRKVNVGITQPGLDLVEQATEAVDKRVRECMKGITESEAVVLNALLDKLRD